MDITLAVANVLGILKQPVVSPQLIAGACPVGKTVHVWMVNVWRRIVPPVIVCRTVFAPMEKATQ